MASEIDYSRLRRQNLFPEIPDLSGGTMGNINISGPEFESDPGGYITEGPQRSSQNYQMGQYNFPNIDFSQANDPRRQVNPTIAGPEQPIGGPGSRGSDDAEELLRIINGLYTPEYTSRDRFNRLLDAAPEREGPGVLRGISAGLMGLGAKDPVQALQIQEGVMFAPHNRAMADWTAKTQPFGNAAQYENTSNVNERNLATSVGTNIVNQRRYDQQNIINQEKNRLNEIRTKAYAMKNAGWTFDFSTPNIIAHSPDGQMVVMGKTGEMDEVDKVTLQGTNAVKAAEARGRTAIQIADVAQEGQNYRADQQGWLTLQNPDGSFIRWNKNTGQKLEYPATGSGGQVRDVTDPVPGANNPRASIQEMNNRMHRFSLERPDLAAKWLIPPISSTGSWGMKPPPTGRDGYFWDTPVNQTELAEYNAVRQAIGLPPMPTTQQQQQPGVPAPQGSSSGLGPQNVPAPPAAAPYVPPTIGPDPFAGGITTQQDPFAQQPNQNAGGGIGSILPNMRQTLRPPAAAGAPVQQGPTGQQGIPNEQGPPPITVPPDAPFTLEQIQNMPYDELRQRAIGFLLQNGKDPTEQNIQIAIANGRLAP
jgi:hypothetical protein